MRASVVSNRFSVIGISVVFCSTLLAVSSVRAEGLTFPGSNCRAATLAAGDDHVFAPYSGTKIKNSGTALTYAICPAPNTDTTTSAAGSLRVNIDTQWGAMSCNLIGTTDDGQTSFTWPTPTLSQDGQSYKYATGIQFIDDLETIVWTCLVPPGDSIYSYTVGD